VIHRHRMGFDRNSALALQIHRIEELILFLALVDRARRLQQSIRQSCFAVIDVRDDAEIARQFDCHESRTMRARSEAVNDLTNWSLNLLLPLPLNLNLSFVLYLSSHQIK